MKKFTIFVVLAMLIGVLVTGCGRQLPDTPVAETTEDSAVVTEETVAEDAAAEEEVATEEEAVAEETTTEDAAEEEVATEEEDTNAIVGDVARGDALFHEVIAGVGMTCASCHNVDSEDRLVGPGMLGLGERAATRVDGETAEEYLIHSIMAPNDYVVDTYPEMVMPQTYADHLSEQDIADLVAYLLSL